MLYKNVINRGLLKIGKYYSKFDKKPAYILALVLHPYYKLAYIKMAWGGAEEQRREQEVGNQHTKNWYDEAIKVVEGTMEEYWNANLIDTFAGMSTNTSADVTKETNIIDWWVKHADIYPTLARIAKDVCAIPAMSDPCEHLFSGGSKIATDRRSWLGMDKFEHLQVLKHAWRSSINDYAATNSITVESVDINEVHLEQFKELLVHDGEMEHELNASELVVTN
ncbi:hypothetical protein SCLCIDRAFT_32920 [Scleroderma citrinum Foug A]|uniref:HAT C-terminal dimerisation domain-containing protein n=1 Tax=Scleroderma citrinum Foug A TaxID=1036808 RepID=A0A0C2ZH24_9AGAM|nr:hypothetical protein SCLCIDRAFT_32920 [Scleroderma citrinum Foug A]